MEITTHKYWDYLQYNIPFNTIDNLVIQYVNNPFKYLKPKHWKQSAQYIIIHGIQWKLHRSKWEANATSYHSPYKYIEIA